MITTILDENDNYWLQLCDVRFACFNTMNSFLNIWVYSNWKHHHHHISYIEPLLKSQYCQCCHCWDPNVAGFFLRSQCCQCCQWQLAIVEIPMLQVCAEREMFQPRRENLLPRRFLQVSSSSISPTIKITHNQDHPLSWLPIIIKKIVKGCCNIIWNKLWNSEYPPIESEMSFPFTWNAKYCGG